MTSTATASRLARTLCACALLMVVTGPGLVFYAVATGSPKRALLFGITFAAVQTSTALVGYVVASRLPGNAVGWLLLVMSAALGLNITASGYGRYSFERGHLPGEALAVWFGGWSFIPIVFGGVALLVYVFPDGRFLSPRWRRTAQVSGLLVLLATLTHALQPGPLEDEAALDNPLGAGGWAGDLVGTLRPLADLGALPVFALATAALIVRYRRSRGVERQQLKWICTALVLVAVSLGITAPGFIAGDVTFFLALFALTAVPVATGVAMLRYRLYDIDVVINRALVYASLTAALAAVYVGTVLVLQLVLRPVTAGSSPAIAASTLAAAALFRPLRSRIQHVVDRRFFRRRYDAGRTVAAFSADLRQQVDLADIGSDLVAVVETTVQPSHVSLWLVPRD